MRDVRLAVKFGAGGGDGAMGISRCPRDYTALSIILRICLQGRWSREGLLYHVVLSRSDIR